MHSIVISCGKCGESASAWLWLNPVHAVELPVGGFQCPNCKVIVHRRAVGSRLIYNSAGERVFVPEKIELVEIS